MTRKKLFNLSRYGLFAAWAVLFAIGFFTRMPDNTSPFMDYPATQLAIAFVAFSFGVHLLYFRTMWADESVRSSHKMLDNKPGWVQAWLGVNRSQEYALTMCTVVGVGFTIWGVLVFVTTPTE